MIGNLKKPFPLNSSTVTVLNQRLVDPFGSTKKYFINYYCDIELECVSSYNALLLQFFCRVLL